MTDRELLEAAAKAAGIEIGWIDQVWGSPEAAPYIHLPGGKLWNPLTDDGDALRLAAKLRISLVHYHDEEAVRASWPGMKLTAPDCRVAYGPPPARSAETAMRLCIVRAAAQIMEESPLRSSRP